MPLAARATSVTATVTDAGSQTWNNGTWSATLVSKPGFYPPNNGYFISGSSTLVPNQSGISGSLDSGGAFSTTLTDNSTIAPAGTAWRIQVCPQASGTCFVASVDIAGVSQNISSSLAPPAIVINMQVPAIGYTAYSDSEVVNGNLGQTYWNLTSQQLKVCQTVPCGWQPLGGSGTVTSLTATSPIVATPSPITGVGVFSCPTCNTSSATIAGSIASPQVAFGSSANTISGSNNFEWDPASGGAIITTSNVGPANVTGAGLAMSNSSGGTTTAYLVKGTDNSLTLRNDSTLIQAHGLLSWDTNSNLLLQGGSSAPQLELYTGASISPFGDGSAILDIFSTGATPHVFAVHADPGAGDKGNVYFNPFTDTLGFTGNVSGTAEIGTATAAGTPNKLNLPTATGTSGQVLTTDGANPQQASWTTPVVSEYCGATSGATQACAKTVQTAPIIVHGDVTLNTATSQSITTLPFSDGTYSCTGSDLTTAAGVVSFSSYLAASVTIAETGGVNTDHLRYICVGN